MKHYGIVFSLIIAGVMALLLITNVTKCSRDKKVNKLDAARLKVLDVDSIRSHVEDSVRAVYRGEIANLNKAIAAQETNYKIIVKKDVQTEYVYRDNPNLANANAALQSKNNRIDTLENRIAKYTKRDSLRLGLISSLERSRLQKDSTIRELNNIALQATNKLQKALKPTRWGIGVQAGGMPTIQSGAVKVAPYAGVGISYNIIRF